MPGNAGFYSSDKENTPPGVKFKSKQNFEPKILVWLATSVFFIRPRTEYARLRRSTFLFTKEPIV